MNNKYAHLPKSPGVYRIVDTVNGRVYVGSSKNVCHRCRAHLRGLVKGTHWVKSMQADFDMHGVSEFEFELVELCEADKLKETETQHLSTRPFYNRQFEAYSNAGMTHSEESKEKIRQAKLGKPRSEEDRRKMSEGRKGIKPSQRSVKLFIERVREMNQSEEHRAKVSAALQGHEVSENTKDKIRATLRERHDLSERTRKGWETRRRKASSTTNRRSRVLRCPAAAG